MLSSKVFLSFFKELIFLPSVFMILLHIYDDAFNKMLSHCSLKTLLSVHNAKLNFNNGPFGTLLFFL